MNRKKIAEDFAYTVKKKNPEIKKIILYGSVASGKDKEKSDIDMMLISESSKRKIKKKIMEDVVKTLLEKSVYISAKIITQKDYKKIRKTHFISEIEKNGVLIG
ncbi:MAG: nucleotidyltransferase domain-containing protein [Candidatus Altiarchaeota archaeon]|nr:nucleotidyltransferase domain-containing protein [Candidatus Altiarchaeota archaeon]